MGMDVCRYIEIYTPDYDGFVDSHCDIDKVGKFLTGDIVMVYNSYGPYHDHYFEITDIQDGYIEYTPLKSPTDIHEALEFVKNINPVWRVESYKDLPNKQLNCSEGAIYSTWRDGKKQYYVRENHEWKIVDNCPHSWKQIKWSKNDNYLNTGLSSFVSEFMYHGWKGEGIYANRGLPADINNEIKNDICSSDFGLTYASLAEIEHCADIIRDRAKQALENKIINTKIESIDNKLDSVLRLLKKDNTVAKGTFGTTLDEDDDYSESFEEVFDEYICDIELAEREYTMIYTMVDAIHGYISPDNVRIIYTFNN